MSWVRVPRARSSARNLLAAAYSVPLHLSWSGGEGVFLWSKRFIKHHHVNKKYRTCNKDKNHYWKMSLSRTRHIHWNLMQEHAKGDRCAAKPKQASWGKGPVFGKYLWKKRKGHCSLCGHGHHHSILPSFSDKSSWGALLKTGGGVCKVCRQEPGAEIGCAR